MSLAAETGFSIFILLVVLCMLKYRSVMFDICEITAMRFKIILYDTDE